MRRDPADELANQVQRRGLAAPARLLLDAHRPLRPLLAHAGTFLTPILGPLLGRRFEAARATIEDPDAYDRLVERLAKVERLAEED